MLVVRKLTVDAYLSGSFDLEWEIEDTTEDISDYRFVVLRSAGPVGQYSPVSPPLEDTYSFADTTVQWDAVSKEYYYKVRVVKNDGEYVDYPREMRAGAGQQGMLGVTIGSPGDAKAREMVRREWLRLHLNTGGYIVFPRRRFGTFCPECVSSGVRRKSNCRTCYDTSYLGGFLRAYEIPGEETPISQQILLTGKGASDMKQLEVQTPPSPKMYAGDVLVDMAGLRWEVSQITLRRHVQLPIMQHALIDLIPLSDAKYDLDADVKSLRENTLTRLKRKADVQHTGDFWIP